MQEITDVKSTVRRVKSWRLGVGGKLILAMVFVSLVSTLAMGLAIRIGFDKGFIEYITERGIQRLDFLLPRVSEAYKVNKSWDFITKTPNSWFDLVGLPGSRPDAPPIVDPEVDAVAFRSIDSSGASLRIALLDSQRNFIIGYFGQGTSSSIDRPIIVDGKTVGWLVYVPPDQVVTEADLQFKEKQDQASFWIGLGSIVIATFIAVYISNRFILILRPIRRSISKLAKGNYQTTLSVASHDEMADLAEDVNYLAMVLERNESMRRDLMADLSHELRTPIAVLQAELEALHDGIRTYSPEKIRSLLTEVNTLSVLVRDVYDVSTSDAGAMSYRFHPVDIADVLDCTILAFNHRLQARNLTLNYPGYQESILVNGDEGRLNQLFNNLLENSLRYTHDGGKISVNVKLQNNLIVINVDDSTPGVPADELDVLFDRSFRGRQRLDSDQRGNGLGLAICKNIVVAHRGSITAKHSNLGGLNVMISLPLAEI